jgi:hypothetical protein
MLFYLRKRYILKERFSCGDFELYKIDTHISYDIRMPIPPRPLEIQVPKVGVEPTRF